MRATETVADVIARLQKLPPLLPVYGKWEGSLLPSISVSEEFVITEGGYGRVDYYPECPLEEDQVRIQAVIIS